MNTDEGKLRAQSSGEYVAFLLFLGFSYLYSSVFICGFLFGFPEMHMSWPLDGDWALTRIGGGRMFLRKDEVGIGSSG
jgi:hypothetical protein